ncbi:hypothetical protein COO60DRAFT_1526201, partial [Scenedesmus sp. NREL 46B-D3]
MAVWPCAVHPMTCTPAVTTALTPCKPAINICSLPGFWRKLACELMMMQRLSKPKLHCVARNLGNSWCCSRC